MSHMGAARVRHFNQWSSYFNVAQTAVLHMFCHMTKHMELKIVYRLLRWWQNASEYRLPSKYAHRPNYCSWLAVCVN